LRGLTRRSSERKIGSVTSAGIAKVFKKRIRFQRRLGQRKGRFACARSKAQSHKRIRAYILDWRLAYQADKDRETAADRKKRLP
jgi:hypothetical protein